MWNMRHGRRVCNFNVRQAPIANTLFTIRQRVFVSRILFFIKTVNPPRGSNKRAATEYQTMQRTAIRSERT